MIELILAQEKDKELYRNLFNLYHNDLALYTDELSEVDNDGFYDKEAVDCYFENDENVIPFVITNDDKIAGLVILTKPPYAKKGCDYCINEFFIVSVYKGKKVAEKACKLLIDKYPGRYCLLILDKNIRAKKYWSKFIDTYATKISEGKYDEQCIMIEFTTK